MNTLNAALLLALAPTPSCAGDPGSPGAAIRPTQPSAPPLEREFDHSHARWTGLLQERVTAEGFDYAAVVADRASLDAYIAELQAVTPEELEGWTEEQRFAFWINVYNAYTIRKVVDNYPLKSIRKLSGAFGLKSVFDQEFIPMRAFHPDGKKDDLSLNDVEHGILRVQFEDARLHAAINCASVSCPPLRAEAFVADRLDEQLEEQMRGFVTDATRNRFDRDSGTMRISEIFKWFEEDFERDAGSVREYLIRFAPEDDREFLRKAKLRYLDYDWGLNEAKSAGR